MLERKVSVDIPIAVVEGKNFSVLRDESQGLGCWKKGRKPYANEVWRGLVGFSKSEGELAICLARVADIAQLRARTLSNRRVDGRGLPTARRAG